MNNVPIKIRFYKKVDVSVGEDKCWIWKGRKFSNGYGGIRNHYTRALAHRVSWEIHYGEIPDGLFVLHRCDNRACVNPNHLFLGTHQDNMKDMMDKGRSSRGEKCGTSKLTANQVKEIRRLSKEGMCSKELQQMFSIAQSTVSEIILRTRWSWLED